jgi:hypothetical protein
MRRAGSPGGEFVAHTLAEARARVSKPTRPLVLPPPPLSPARTNTQATGHAPSHPGLALDPGHGRRNSGTDGQAKAAARLAATAAGLLLPNSTTAAAAVSEEAASALAGAVLRPLKSGTGAGAGSTSQRLPHIPSSSSSRYAGINHASQARRHASGHLLPGRGLSPTCDF